MIRCHGPTSGWWYHSFYILYIVYIVFCILYCRGLLHNKSAPRALTRDGGGVRITDIFYPYKDSFSLRKNFEGSPRVYVKGRPHFE